MKAFLIGLIVGCVICSVAWPLGYAASLNPGAAWSAPAATASIVLWPTSLMLLAVQPSSTTLFSMQVLGIAVLTNGFLYGLVSGIGYLAIRGATAESRSTRCS
jgi:hypothetical protein